MKTILAFILGIVVASIGVQGTVHAVENIVVAIQTFAQHSAKL